MHVEEHRLTVWVYTAPLGSSCTVCHKPERIFHTSHAACGHVRIETRTICLFISRGQWGSKFRTRALCWLFHNRVIISIRCCWPVFNITIKVHVSRNLWNNNSCWGSVWWGWDSCWVVISCLDLCFVMVCFRITIVKHLGQWLLYYVCYIDFARTMYFNDKAQHI